MWLVLCDINDISAAWAYRALRARGLSPVAMVSAHGLALGECREHRIGRGGTSVRLATDDGLEIDGAELRGVLNRLCTVPVDHWRQASKADRDYAQQELVALTLSWLHSLPCPVINRPTPQGLCGQWRHESEWVWLAMNAGLPVAPYRQSARDRIDEMRGERRLVSFGSVVRTVIVLDGEVVGSPPPASISAACRRLALEASTELLGIDFVTGAAGPWTFAGASPAPELKQGGDALIQELTRQFGIAGAAA